MYCCPGLDADLLFIMVLLVCCVPTQVWPLDILWSWWCCNTINKVLNVWVWYRQHPSYLQPFGPRVRVRVLVSGQQLNIRDINIEVPCDAANPVSEHWGQGGRLTYHQFTMGITNGHSADRDASFTLEFHVC